MCAGKDCRKRCEFAKLREALELHAHVVELKCVGICAGPVVIVNAGSNSAAMYAKVRTKTQRRNVLRAVDGLRRATRDLSSIEVSGKRRRAALKRVDRAVG